MSKIDIEQLRSLPNYAQPTKWDIQFLQLPVIGVLGAAIGDRLNLQAENVEWPKGNSQNFEVQTRGHKVFQTGILDYGNTLTIGFVETEDNVILKLVKAWRELQWSSRQGRSFPKSQVEATLLITAYDGQNNIRAKTTVYGCIYQADDFGTLDGNTSDAIKPTVTLNFDYFVDAPLV